MSESITEYDMEVGIELARNTPGCYLKTQGDCNFAARLANRERRLEEVLREIERLKTKFAPLLAMPWVGHTKSATITAMSDEEGLRHIKRGTYAIHRLEAAEARVVELEQQLKSIFQQVTNGRLCYFGDHTGYEPQFSTEQTTRWAKLIYPDPETEESK